ncbi:Zinc knuckle [Popillia japonica]|uniref:Zinc knuckle n=1 Tax=Popillia japonica TaxID=7064 RepID=A0AAW1IV68_POPJA
MWADELCTQHGGQNATVVLDKMWADELCKRGTIRIGWTPCTIRQRVNITRCYRCLDFGHKRWECQGVDNTNTCLKCGKSDHRAKEWCQGVDNTNTCLKCGKSDHRAKECTEESFCVICKKPGHRADQTRCPHYRKLISEKAKELTRMKEGTSMGLERKPTRSSSRRDNTTSVQHGSPKGPAERKVQQQQPAWG